MRVPLGLKSSPSSVTQRVRTSRLNASVRAVTASCSVRAVAKSGHHWERLPECRQAYPRMPWHAPITQPVHGLLP